MATRIATRKSPLARCQTELVTNWLASHAFKDLLEVIPFRTEVDVRLKWSLEERGGLGLFTKELEDALSENRADLAVHSAKDMPTTLPPGLVIAGYLPRADARDVLVTRSKCEGAPRRIATSSPRRRSQLQGRYPEVKWETIRGNVTTRLQKIHDGEADATVLAAAGLKRLGIESFKGLDFEFLPISNMVPAPGQAAIAVECREADLERYKAIFCLETERMVEFERAILRGLGSGCQTPVGAYFADGVLHLYHPSIGYRSTSLPLPYLKEVQTVADSIIEQFNL
jgi:hydroxymethylbilane synthase